MAEHIRVNAPGGEDYDIIIAPGLLHNSAHFAGAFPLAKRVAVITNDTIAPLHGEALVNTLPNAVLVTMGDGEQHKNMETVTRLCRELARAGVDRGSTVIALGGGVVGDTAGYVAASYMRGVRLVQVPTSLLAMVDSSVGGKVGVDIPEGKNLVGAFKQPTAVLIDPDTLGTLPEIEWRNGLAEVIKHGLIADAEILDMVREISIPEPDTAKLTALLRRAIQVKVNVVAQDPYEQGVRQHLNLGHTFAHAIERVSEYGVPHGMAVGMGINAAAALSAKLGLCDAQLAATVTEIVGHIQPTRVHHMDDYGLLWEAMKTDKKWRDGRSRFVLLEDIGKPVVVEDVPRDVVIEVLQSLRY